MEFEQKILLEAALLGEKWAVEELVRSLEPLIKSSIKKYYYRKHLYQDLIQEGRLCVCESLKSFDPSKGVHLLGYIKTKLSYLYLNMNREREFESLDIDLGDGFSLVDTLVSDTDIEKDFIRESFSSELSTALNELTKIEQEIIISFYIKEKSLSQIAKEMGRSYRTVVNNKERALNKLRARLTKFYY